MNDFSSVPHFALAIDLGAKRTGCFMAGAVALHEDPADPAVGARGLVVESDKEALTLQQTARRQMRHLRRNYKRRKLAKRLAQLWLAERWPGDADPVARAAAERFIRGLMNRRGFTHFSLDEKIDLDRLEKARSGLAALGLLELAESIPDWVARTVSDPDQARQLLGRPELRLRDQRGGKKRASSTALSDHLRTCPIDEADLKATAAGLAHLRDLLAEAAQSDQTGHKHRHDYLQAIERDLESTDAGQQVLRFLHIDAHGFANFLGHISNLNLPGLRRYFHDSSRAALRALDPQRFLMAWTAFFRRWTLSGESGERREQARQRRRDWLERLDGLGPDTDPALLRESLWSLLTRHDALTSIPPFEAQANRRPPECQSLLLSPKRLDRATAHGETVWRAWAQAFQRADSHVADGLDEIAAADAQVIGRESRPVGATEKQAALTAAIGRWRDARCLQRVLERSRDLDAYALRLLTADVAGSSSTASRKVEEAHARLAADLGEQHLTAFLAFARRYYAESREARTGVWLGAAESLLTRCDAHPPHKRHLLPLIVSQILSLGDAVADGLPDRIRALASHTVHPDPAKAAKGKHKPRGLLRVLGDCAERVKELGGDLRLLEERARYRSQLGKEPTDAEQAAVELYAYAQAAARTIASELGLDANETTRFANPYSMSQLHQALFDDPSGFNTTCRACTRENAWRARLDTGGHANATRLPADSIRPFDGVLARLLEATASRIAASFVEAIPDLPPGRALRIPILIEENRFSFVAQMAELKGQPQSRIRDLRQRLDAARGEREQEWLDKYQRIRSEGGGLCPYCGDPVGDDGDYDHIVGQAVTRDAEGYAFDSEANLIFAHRGCNQRKGRALYGLADLAPAWLVHQFSATEPAALESRIRGEIESWLDERDERRAFHQLGQDLRRDLRHALFLPGLRERVLSRLAMQNVARVNGTQRWFGRTLIDRVAAVLVTRGVGREQLHFSLHRVPAQEVAALRSALARLDPALAKAERQGPYSHVIDAALVYAVASTQPTVRASLGLPLTDAGPALLEYTDPARALALLPPALEIRRLERKPIHDKDHAWHRPIFKANPIGERFVPLMVDASARLWCGFDTEDNRVEVPPPKPAKAARAAPAADRRIELLRTLWPVLGNAPRHLDPASPRLLEELGALAAASPRALVWLHVDRSRAFRHWQSKRVDPEDALAKHLDALVYRIQRKPIEPLLFPADGKPSPTRDELLKTKDFQVRIDLAGAKRSLAIPARAEWRRLADDPRLAPHLGKRLVRANDRLPGAGADAETDTADERAQRIDWIGLVADHFPRQSSGRRHHRVGQVIALPRRAEASGGFRLARRTPSGAPTFQLVQADKGAYAGFARSPGDVLGFDCKQPALLPVLARSARITPLDRRRPIDDFAGFSEAQAFTADSHPALAEHGIESIAVAAGSLPRRKLRARIRWAALRDLFDAPVPTDPGLEIGSTSLALASLGNEADIRALDALKSDPALIGAAGRQAFSERSKALKAQCTERVKATKSRLARILGEVVGLPGLAPREDEARIDGWDQNTVWLSWTGGSGAGRGEDEDAEEDDGP